MIELLDPIISSHKINISTGLNVHYLEASLDKYNNKKGQTSNQTQYIKIHETNRNDPIIVGTNRRILLLKTEINKKHIYTLLPYRDYRKRV